MNNALIFAGGTGERMNSKSKPKQFLELHGKPIIIYTIEWFEKHKDIDGIVVVCLESWIGHLKKLIEQYQIKKVKWIVKGSKTSQLSIFNGLEILYKSDEVPNDSIVIIHDGVRPLINENLITKNIQSVKKYGSGITMSSAKETIVTINKNQKVDSVSNRALCRIAKAPQSFYLKDIYTTHVEALNDGVENLIDSASLMNYYGYSLHGVCGPEHNIKITTPIDYYVFKSICDARENSQIFGIEEE